VELLRASYLIVLHEQAYSKNEARTACVQMKTKIHLVIISVQLYKSREQAMAKNKAYQPFY